MDCFLRPEIDLPRTQSLSDKYCVAIFYLPAILYLPLPYHPFFFHSPVRAPSCLCLVQKSYSSSQNLSLEMPPFSSFLRISSLKGFAHSCLLPWQIIWLLFSGIFSKDESQIQMLYRFGSLISLYQMSITYEQQSF